MKAFGVLLVGVLVASCHGGGGGDNPTPPTPPPPTAFTVGGSVTGLAGTGLELRNNAGNPLAVAANGTFTFGGTVASGSAYSVTVGVQPTSASQTCVVAAGSGTATANVTGISVTCTTNAFSVGVTVDGLFTDLIFGQLILENNGGDLLTLTANGPATFATNIASGSAYSVAVRKHPNGTPQQTCTVSGGTGTVGNGPTSGIAVSCRAPAGRFLYVASAAPDGVAAFSIDKDTGALTPIAGSPFASAGQAPRAVFADPTGTYLGVYGDDNPTAPGATTLDRLKVDPQTGALQPIAGMPVILPAAQSTGAAHPSGKFVYAPTSDGTLSANNQLRVFAVDSTTGALTELPAFRWGPFGPGEMINAAVLSKDGSSLYVATSTPFVAPTPPTAKIIQLAVNTTTGELTATASQVVDPANTFNQLIVAPAGTHMYTRNAQSPFTSRFRLDATTGAIGSRVNATMAFGTGVVIDPIKTTAYFPFFGGTFATPAPGSVWVANDEPFNNIATVLGDPFPTGGTNSLAAILDPTSRFLALTNIGSHDISVFKTGMFETNFASVTGSPFTPAVGTAPGSLIYDPSGRFAFVTDGTTNTVSSYKIDMDTGVPTFVNSPSTGGVPGGISPVAIFGRQ